MVGDLRPTNVCRDQYSGYNFLIKRNLKCNENFLNYNHIKLSECDQILNHYKVYSAQRSKNISRSQQSTEGCSNDKVKSNLTSLDDQKNKSVHKNELSQCPDKHKYSNDLIPNEIFITKSKTEQHCKIKQTKNENILSEKPFMIWAVVDKRSERSTTLDSITPSKPALCEWLLTDLQQHNILLRTLECDKDWERSVTCGELWGITNFQYANYNLLISNFRDIVRYGKLVKFRYCSSVNNLTGLVCRRPFQSLNHQLHCSKHERINIYEEKRFHRFLEKTDEANRHNMKAHGMFIVFSGSLASTPVSLNQNSQTASTTISDTDVCSEHLKEISHDSQHMPSCESENSLEPSQDSQDNSACKEIMRNTNVLNHGDANDRLRGKEICPNIVMEPNSATRLRRNLNSTGHQSQHAFIRHTDIRYEYDEELKRIKICPERPNDLLSVSKSSYVNHDQLHTLKERRLKEYQRKVQNELICDQSELSAETSLLPNDLRCLINSGDTSYEKLFPSVDGFVETVCEQLPLSSHILVAKFVYKQYLSRNQDNKFFLRESERKFRSFNELLSRLLEKDYVAAVSQKDRQGLQEFLEFLDLHPPLDKQIAGIHFVTKRSIKKIQRYWDSQEHCTAINSVAVTTAISPNTTSQLNHCSQYGDSSQEIRIGSQELESLSQKKNNSRRKNASFSLSSASTLSDIDSVGEKQVPSLELDSSAFSSEVDWEEEFNLYLPELSANSKNLCHESKENFVSDLSSKHNCELGIKSHNIITKKNSFDAIKQDSSHKRESDVSLSELHQIAFIPNTVPLSSLSMLKRIHSM